MFAEKCIFCLRMEVICGAIKLNSHVLNFVILQVNNNGKILYNFNGRFETTYIFIGLVIFDGEM